ncbi:uncharacterized protein ARMOST_02302 [Armillaria ostoyae]|uniref:Uncharacterized protein n=1 Tax=Armillaria ostoyae TaxID=47428 RepID=A0A284QRK1_ARMOS|nr:uncharacterized protein ARMOST_02302 [Armillaria ostoyae]
MAGASGQAIVARARPSIVPISDLRVAISDVEAMTVSGMQPMGEEGGGHVVGSGGGGW